MSARPPEIESIYRQVCRHLDKRVDRESIASEIWLGCWLSGRQPSPVEIRHRCYDALRRLRVETNGLERVASGDSYDHDGHWSVNDDLDTIMSRATLSSQHRQVLYRKFYLDEAMGEIAEEMNTTEGRVRALLAEALEELRRVGRGLI